MSSPVSPLRVVDELSSTNTPSARLSSKETRKIKNSNFPEAESLVSSEQSRAAAASAVPKSSDNASAETASPADTDPRVSPGAAAATSRFGEDELVLRPQTSREVVANETRRETSGTVAAGVAGLAS